MRGDLFLWRQQSSTETNEVRSNVEERLNDVKGKEVKEVLEEVQPINVPSRIAAAKRR